MSVRFLIAALLAAAAALLPLAGTAPAAGHACPSSNAPNELVLAGGSGQTAQLGKPFPSPLQVQLANSNGCPLTTELAGVNIDFDAPGAGASGIFAGSGSREAVVGTDAQGVATAPAFTANFTAGSYTVDAHSDDGTVELFLSNTASGVAAAVAAASGSGQQASANALYAQPLQARVTDANGNPVQGATVGFSVVPGPTGAGAAFLGGQATATTGSDGIATAPPLLANGSPGRFVAVASVEGVAAVATYALDNAAASETLLAGVGSGQSATVGGRFAHPLAVRVLDPGGQPLEGASVTFALGGAAGAAGATFLSGGGTATVLTDANGVAMSPALVANGTPGGFTAVATTPGAAAPVVYRLTALAARVVAVRPEQSAVAGGRFAHRLEARVVDSLGRPVAGATVTFAVTKSAAGATAAFPDGGAQATATTGADGRAVAPALVAGTADGSYSALASTAGGTPARYALANRPAAPATVTAGAASGETTRVGTAFPVRLAVTVDDRYGNPVAGAVVVFAGPRHGASGAFTVAAHGKRHASRVVRVRTNADGIAVAPRLTANRVGGGFVVTAGVRGAAQHASFALVNDAG